MAKKKKPLVNPNRGFATTSIASKPKPETLKEPTSPEPISKAEDAPLAQARTQAIADSANGGDAREKEFHELSADELEARLEDAELQTLVDKYSAKTTRDASRHVSKMQTDHRILRKAAQPLHLRNLLLDEVMWQILDYAKDDAQAGSLLSIAASDHTPSVVKEDELVANLWTLQNCLASMGFTEEQASSAQAEMLEHPPSHSSTALAWGLDESLDWLALNLADHELPCIDDQTGQALSRPDPSITDDGVIEKEVEQSIKVAHKADSSVGGEAPKQPRRLVDSPPSSVEEFDVSDLDSDLEPDELLSAYLTSKARLFEAQPDLLDSRAGMRKSTTNVRNRPGASPAASQSVKKLQQKIEKIESDVLFDKRDADAQWVHARDALAQEAAERRKNQLPLPHPSTSARKMEVPATPSESSRSSMGSDDTEIDDGAVGNLFRAESSTNTAPIPQLDPDASPDIVTSIRDFGKPSGVSARRVLEDACHAKDASARLTYKLVSLTAFSNRHTLMINWSKDQSTKFPLQLASTKCQSSAHLCAFTMKTVATPDERQSEAFVSVIALFQIFSTSTKEEKIYLRLPPVWRDLYLELLNQKKLEAELDDKESVRIIRDRVRQYLENQPQRDEEEVIHTPNFKKRVTDNERSRSSSATPGTHALDAEHLRQLWQMKSETSAYQQMLRSRMNLPMFQFKEAALSAVEQNQVTIICGETGCGKSTQMPAFILEHQLQLGKACKVYCTEPRRISAITLAQRVSQELGEAKSDVGTLRSLVGYAIRLESHTSRNTRLVYATTGIVLRMLESGDSLRDVTHVVIDEVHERSIETDFLLIILRSLMVKRPDLKVVLMSATVDAHKFATYFNGAPILNVPGRTFPVEQRFLEDALQVTGHVVGDDDQRNLDDDEEGEATVPSTDDSAMGNVEYMKQYSSLTRKTLLKYDEYRLDYELIIKLINQIAFGPDYHQYSNAILVFLPGIAEIRALGDMISSSRLAQTFIVYPLHSAIPSEDQQRAFDPPPRGTRKIVISTNIAETGVTIPDVTCVIDTGKHKEMRFDERRQISRLIESFISQANAKQRRGRAGRVQPGLCFHLFTRQRHDTIMSTEQTPEMLRLSLQDLVMRVKICKLGDIQSTLADALDPPSSKNVRRAIDALIEVGALTTKEDLTALGQQLSKLPLDPYLGKLVLHGALFSCLDTTITIAAILTSKSPFTAPLNARHSADAARLAFSRNESDLLTDYNAYASWRRVCSTQSQSEAQFCRRNFLSAQTLSNIEDLKAQLLSSLADSGIVQLELAERLALSRIQNSGNFRRRTFVTIPTHFDRNSAIEASELISAVIAWSFYPKLLIREGKGWRNISTSQVITIHPTSILRSFGSETLGRIKFLSFYSILQSSHGAKNYNASSLTPVAALPLMLLAGEATFQTYAGVISIDGSRLRFLIESREGRAAANGRAPPGIWKTVTGLKVFRRRLEEIVEHKWKRPGKELPVRLRRWWALWEKLVEEVWAKKGPDTTGTPTSAPSLPALRDRY